MDTPIDHVPVSQLNELEKERVIITNHQPFFQLRIVETMKPLAIRAALDIPNRCINTLQLAKMN